MKAQYVTIEEVHVVMTPEEARYIKALTQNNLTGDTESIGEMQLRAGIFQALAQAEKK